jgi:hypothetical protein
MIDAPPPGPPVTATFRLTPRLLLAGGGLVLAAVVAFGIVMAPRESRILAAILALPFAAGLGALFVHFLSLRCRLELAHPYRTLSLSIGRTQKHIELASIASVTTPLDERADEVAHHVALELRDGRRILLHDDSWGRRHAERLAAELRQFLDRARAAAQSGPSTSA